jgi:fructosamine-3-kinase
MWSDLLRAHLGGRWGLRALGNSAFCDTWQAADGSARLFLKSAGPTRAAVLGAEADGLAALAAVAGAVRVPAVAGLWTADSGHTVLAMEWLDLSSRPPAAFGAAFGHGLATLHRAAAPGEGRFGWHRDNWLGGTPQGNRWSALAGRDGWLAFLAEQRLLAFADGLAPALRAAVGGVVDRLPACFDDGHVPRPSLIHGDLWQGNWGALAGGEPVIFDPAVSVSDAEAELAMMELFGAPPAGFWPAYREHMRLDEGYPRRRAVYQLVHLLNHARLFGGGYVAQAMAVAASLTRGR